MGESGMNRMNEYIEFYANKHNLEIDIVKKSIEKSNDVFGKRGWNGGEFGKLTDTMAAAMQWKYIAKEKSSSFFSDDGVDFMKCYDYMQDLDLMRMLSYSISLNNLAMKGLVQTLILQE